MILQFPRVVRKARATTATHTGYPIPVSLRSVLSLFVGRRTDNYLFFGSNLILRTGPSLTMGMPLPPLSPLPRHKQRAKDERRTRTIVERLREICEGVDGRLLRSALQRSFDVTERPRAASRRLRPARTSLVLPRAVLDDGGGQGLEGRRDENNSGLGRDGDRRPVEATVDDGEGAAVVSDYELALVHMRLARRAARRAGTHRVVGLNGDHADGNAVEEVNDARVLERATRELLEEAVNYVAPSSESEDSDEEREGEEEGSGSDDDSVH